jgi:hypothetical protein
MSTIEIPLNAVMLSIRVMMGMDGTPGMVAAEMGRQHWNEFPDHFQRELRHTLTLYREKAPMPGWEWLPQ